MNNSASQNCFIQRIVLHLACQLRCSSLLPRADEPMQTCRKIVSWRQYLRFPEEVPVAPLARDLICRLLCDVDDRIGTHGGAAEIKVPQNPSQPLALCAVVPSKVKVKWDEWSPFHHQYALLASNLPFGQLDGRVYLLVFMTIHLAIIFGSQEVCSTSQPEQVNKAMQWCRHTLSLRAWTGRTFITLNRHTSPQ